MKKKSLSWVLAIIMAFTVFGIPGLGAGSAFALMVDAICTYDNSGYTPVTGGTEKAVGDEAVYYFCKDNGSGKYVPIAETVWEASDDAIKIISTNSTDGSVKVKFEKATKGVSLNVYKDTGYTPRTDEIKSVEFSISEYSFRQLDEESWTSLEDGTIEITLGSRNTPEKVQVALFKEPYASGQFPVKKAGDTYARLCTPSGNAVKVSESTDYGDCFVLNVTPNCLGTQTVKATVFVKQESGTTKEIPVSFDVNVVEPEYEVCQLSANPIGLVLNLLGPTLKEAISGLGEEAAEAILSALTKVAGDGLIKATKVKTINTEFMDIYSDGLAGYIGSDMDLNGMCYAVCEKGERLVYDSSSSYNLYSDAEGETRYPVTCVDSLQWDSDNLDVMTMNDVLEAALGDHYETVMESAFRLLVNNKASVSSTMGYFGIDISNVTLTENINDCPQFKQFCTLFDSLAVVMGSKEGSGYLNVDAVVNGQPIEVTGPKTSVEINREVEKISGFQVDEGTNSATITWNPIDKLFKLSNESEYTNDKTYTVYLEKAGENNHNFKAVVLEKINSLMKKVHDVANFFDLEEYIGEYIGTTPSGIPAEDTGWIAVKNVDTNSVKFDNLEAGTSYNVVVVAMQGTGNKYDLLNGVKYYDKGSMTYGSKTFRVGQKIPEATDIANAVVTVKNAVYNGEEQAPVIAVKLDGNALTQNKDYTVSAPVCKAAGTYSVVISGTGSFSGTKTVDYTISKYDLSKAEVTLSQDAYVWEGEKEYKPEVKSVKDSAGKTIPASDYEVTYKNNKAIGTATVVVTAKGTNCEKAAEKNFAIAEELNINNCTIDYNTVFVYSDDYNQPEVTVYNGIIQLEEDKDYTVSYESSTKYVGTYTVTVAGKGDYVGTYYGKYDVNPRSTVITGVAKGKKKFTVKWEKRKAQVDGYIIQYARNSQFTGAKKATVKSASTVKKTIKNLSAKKKYYVRVQTYKYDKNDVKHVSEWSNKKSVTTK